MHWTEKFAQEVIKKYPDKEVYTIASGITPSGSVHIGNFREFITSYLVGVAIKNAGKNVKMIFSWDNFDRLRKVPSNVANMGVEQFIGMPVSHVPDPFKKEVERGKGGAKWENSYGRHFEKEFEDGLARMELDDIPVRMIYQTKEYESGRYNEKIIHAIKNRGRIYDIITSFKTQDADEGARKDYYPMSVYCKTCGKDSTKVLGFDDATAMLTYKCKCGAEHTMDVHKADNIKLVWKVDWPMRWSMEDVVFEPGGPDHMTMGGSYSVAAVVAKEIFNFTAPVSMEYGFVGIKGDAVKISSSKGNAPTPLEILNIYEADIIKWLYHKYAPRDFFEFGFDDTIVRHYAEYDAAKAANPAPVSFGLLATLGPLCGFNEKMVRKVLALPHDADLSRLNKVKYWLENYAPDKIYKLLEKPNTEFFKTLDAKEATTVKKLAEFLSKDAREEKAIQEFLYSIINDPSKEKKQNVEIQKRYFKIFYNLLFGRDDGPRLYLYLAVAQKECHKLLNFS